MITSSHERIIAGEKEHSCDCKVSAHKGESRCALKTEEGDRDSPFMYVADDITHRSQPNLDVMSAIGCGGVRGQSWMFLFPSR